MSDLHDRAAKALGWSTSDVRSLSMQSLRDLVRPVDPALAREMDYMIQSGAYVRGPALPRRSHARRRGTSAPEPRRLTCENCDSGLVLEDPSYGLVCPSCEVRVAGPFTSAHDIPDYEPARETTMRRKRTHAAKKIAKDIEAAVRAAQLYIGKGLTLRIADEQKLYNSMNRKIASVAKRRGLDDANAYQQIMAEAKRRGGITPMPGKDI